MLCETDRPIVITGSLSVCQSGCLSVSVCIARRKKLKTTDQKMNMCYVEMLLDPGDILPWPLTVRVILVVQSDTACVTDSKSPRSKRCDDESTSRTRHVNAQICAAVGYTHSLILEATAAAEASVMCQRARRLEERYELSLQYVLSISTKLWTSITHRCRLLFSVILQL